MTRRSAAILLLDVDGVLLDIAAYDREWEQLADTVLVPLLGARADGWAALRRRTWAEVLEREYSALWSESVDPRPLPAAFWSALFAQWIDALCCAALIDVPQAAEARSRLAQQAFDAYYRTTGAVVPGARETIDRLSGRFELHMASGNPACIVESVLEGIGVRERVGLPFGSDLAGAFKEESPRFYRAIFDRLGARAREVWVVDDSDAQLLAASALGARTIKIGASRHAARHDLVVDRLCDVPDALDAVAG